MSSEQSFKVYSRCRPLNQRERLHCQGKRSIEIYDQTTLSVSGQSQVKQSYFQFDYAFSESSNNIDIFNESVSPLIENFINGYNSTVFAYGITGAGKSFTMFGKASSQIEKDDQLGLIPLSFQYLLNRLAQENEANFKMSYIQIYNQQVYDLLKQNSENLQIIEDPINGVFVNNLAQNKIKTVSEALQFIAQGNTRRVVAETKCNQFSSRSHAIVLISMQRKIGQKILNAKFSLVDLAGSERQNAYSEAKGLRNLQGSNINRSLLTLGNCINILSQKKKNSFVPYRDSKLTRLLKDSLGGNTRTVMIACVSPSAICYEETLNTLKYACRAKKIQKNVIQNIKDNKAVEQYKVQIQKLRKQNQQLRKKLVAKDQELQTKINKQQKIQNKTILLKKLECKEQPFQKEKKIIQILNTLIGVVKDSAKYECSKNKKTLNPNLIKDSQKYQKLLIKELINQFRNVNSQIDSLKENKVARPPPVTDRMAQSQVVTTNKNAGRSKILNLYAFRAQLRQGKKLTVDQNLHAGFSQMISQSSTNGRLISNSQIKTDRERPVSSSKNNSCFRKPFKPVNRNISLFQAQRKDTYIPKVSVTTQLDFCSQAEQQNYVESDSLQYF